MRKIAITSVLYTVITAFILGIVYPVFITLIVHYWSSDKANGELVQIQGKVMGSHLLGQAFTGDKYFHNRPSAAGVGYDAASSSGSNLGPTSKALADRVLATVAVERVENTNVPIDLVTASGSGLDPDITPAAALYQVPRVAQSRYIPEETLRRMVLERVTPRQFGLLGEPRVNVLQLNLDLIALQQEAVQ